MKFYLLVYNCEESVESQPKFRRNMSSSYSGSKRSIFFMRASCLAYYYLYKNFVFLFSIALYVYKINNTT
jgi:hypothetical protein